MKNLIALLSCMLILIHQSFGQDQPNVYANNIVIVLDTSGSMGNPMNSKTSRLDAAKQALNAMIDYFPDNTNVGLVTFSHDIESSWLHNLGPASHVKLKGSINQLQAAGGTPLGAYLKIGADALLEQRSKQMGYGSYRLIVVTDGEAGDNSKMEKFAPDIVSRGIYLDVTGVDMDKDHTLSKLSSIYRRANDPQTFTAAMKEAVAEIGSSGASNVDTSAMFDEISGLDPEVAAEAIRILNETGNHPIGEKPPIKPSAAINPTVSNNGLPSSVIIILIVVVIVVLFVAVICSMH